MSSIIADKWENFAKIADLIEKNIKKGTDIIILPEVWNVGWKPSEFEDSAEDLENSETIEFLSELAQRYNVNIIGGSFIGKRETGNGKRNFNTCPIINKNGELIATYDKMHLFSYYGCDEGKYITKGENPVIVEYCWDTGEIALPRLCETLSIGSDKGCPPKQSCTQDSKEIASCECLMPSQQPSSRNDDSVKIGLSLCYDIRFPEIYRAYRKAGADILINMAAWPKSREIHWEALSKVRAIENQCFMVALTQSGLIEGDEYNLGHSRIIDYNGEILSEIAQGEGAMFAEIKFEEMYKFREKCTVLNDICDEYDF